MPTAATQFRERLQVLHRMVALDASCDNAFGITQRGKVKLVEGIRASLSVLPVAFFEDFLRILAAQYIDAINRKNPRIGWTRLPDSFRKAHLSALVALPKKFSTEDQNAYESRILPDLNTTFMKVLSPHVAPTAYIVAADAFMETHSNPNAETVGAMFNRLGCNNVFGEAEVIRQMTAFDPVLNNAEAIRRQLNNIVSRRHTVAHGRPVTGITRQELEQGMLFLEVLAKALQTAANDTFRRL